MSAPKVPMSFWSLERVAAALASEVTWSAPEGSTPLTGISTDTRSIRRGSLFVALRGENFDAHDFLKQAVDGGAAALVIDRPERARGLGVPTFHVRDTTRALGALGAHRRRVWNGPVVAIAGSNGKTTTKELVRSALNTRLSVHATTGNLNNLVGVPLTLLAIPDDADIAVVELGTNAPGEVARLREIVGPDIAVVTSIGEEHLEGLGSLEGVLREETAVFDGVRIGIIPGGDPALEKAARGMAETVVVAGLDGGDLRASSWRVGEDGIGEAQVDGVAVRAPVVGAHNLRNAMLALAVARACGIGLEEAAKGIAAATIPGMRSARSSLGRATLIHDAYNANPPSMRAALDLLDATGGGRQRVAILGTMRELGAQSSRCHAEIAEHALRSSIEVIAGLGEFAPALDRAAKEGKDSRIVTAPDVEELWTKLRPLLQPDAVILLKASRGVKLERIMPFLTEWSSQQAGGQL